MDGKQIYLWCFVQNDCIWHIYRENEWLELNIIEKIILFHGLWYQRMKYEWFVFNMYCIELIVIITYMWFMKRLVNNNQKWNIFAISKYNRIVNSE